MSSTATLSWIDTHVHLFGANDNQGSPLFFARKAPHTTSLYLDVLQEHAPAGVVVVDFSKSEHSKHVIDSLEELKEKHIPAVGVIKGNVQDERTFEWIEREDIKAIRLYAKDAVPDLSKDKEQWDRLFNTIRHHGKHVLVFGACRYLPELIAQIPDDIPVVIDHLGLPDAERGANDHAFTTLLHSMKSRSQSAGKVYYKGPGYRTSMSPEKVQPFVNAIIDTLGEEALILGASDGPFAGPVLDPAPIYADKTFGEVMDYDKVASFVTTLAETAASTLGKDVDALKQAVFFTNAKNLYGF